MNKISQNDNSRIKKYLDKDTPPQETKSPKQTSGCTLAITLLIVVILLGICMALSIVLVQNMIVS